MRSLIVRTAELDRCMECESAMMSLVNNNEHQVILATSAQTPERSRPFISKTWNFIDSEHHHIRSATQHNTTECVAQSG